jgi:hypothetical protein
MKNQYIVTQWSAVEELLLFIQRNWNSAENINTVAVSPAADRANTKMLKNNCREYARQALGI